MRFHHHPDGIIYINDLQLPFDFFLSLEPDYSLPSNAISQEYKQGRYHRFYSSDSQWGNEEKWLEGDRYLGKIQIYKQAWEDYQKSLITPFIELPITPNWQGLTQSLRGTPLFGKIYAASKSRLDVNVPFTLMSATLNSSNPNIQDLHFALVDAKNMMGEMLTIVDIAGVTYSPL